jgi:ParB-like chromosome segregation protein Spo0J
MSDVYGMPAHPAAELFPMLADDELQELADDIRAHGLRERVWVWDDPERGPVLLDGRNRVAACKLAGVRPETRAFQGDELAALEFVISENVKRRHLTTGQKAAVAYESLPMFEAAMAKRKAKAKAEAIARQRRDERGRLASDVDRLSADRHSNGGRKQARATDQAAKKAGASGRSTARYKRIAEQAPDLIDKIREGMALDRAERIIRDRLAEKKRIEQAKREAAMQGIQTRVDIRHGDFREVLAGLQDVDAIITDPPYPREYLPLLADLATWADKVLKPDGLLAVLMGQTYLPEVYRLLDGGRPYRWTACYLTPGNGYASHVARVQCNWKPLIVYGGGPRFTDIIRSEGTDAAAKDNHHWGQDYGAFHAVVKRLTERGQTVVDPFMGSGTTMLAAHALGRHAIGCDTDPDAVTKAKERLG